MRIIVHLLGKVGRLPRCLFSLPYLLLGDRTRTSLRPISTVTEQPTPSDRNEQKPFPGREISVVQGLAACQSSELLAVRAEVEGLGKYVTRDQGGRRRDGLRPVGEAADRAAVAQASLLLPMSLRRSLPNLSDKFLAPDPLMLSSSWICLCVNRSVVCVVVVSVSLLFSRLSLPLLYLQF